MRERRLGKTTDERVAEEVLERELIVPVISTNNKLSPTSRKFHVVERIIQYV